MAKESGSPSAGMIAVLIAVIGFISSPVWGPPICQAVGVCRPETISGPGIVPTPPTRPPGGGQPPTLPAPPADFGPASIFLSQTGGPAGSTVKVSGEGFSPGETVVVRFHTTEVGRTTAGANGSFSSVEVTVPADYGKFAPQQFDVVATGRSSIKSARAPYTVSG